MNTSLFQHIFKVFWILCLCTFICPTLSAREKRKAFSVGYRLNITRIESDFKNNDKRVEDILSYLEEVSQDSTISIIGVDFCGAASPEGSYEWNRYLAKERLRSLEKIILPPLTFWTASLFVMTATSLGTILKNRWKTQSIPTRMM